LTEVEYLGKDRQLRGGKRLNFNPQTQTQTKSRVGSKPVMSSGMVIPQ